MMWIPVSEKLPEMPGYYLVSLGNENVNGRFGKVTDAKAVLDNDIRTCSYRSGNFYYDKVAAWMPLPKPYREIEE